jgi:hypothetical protein
LTNVGPRPLMLAELHRLSQVLQSSAHPTMLNGEIRSAHDAVLSLLDEVRSKREIDELLNDATWRQLRVELTRLNAEIHRLTEIDLARRYITSIDVRDPFEGSWINKGFSALLARQVRRWRAKGLFRCEQSGPIVIVGGGALPQTQVFLSRALRCDVISVERDAESAEMCREVLRRVGCGHLDVVQADGVHYDYVSAYLVVVATLVAERDEIARRVALTSADAFFAPRTPVGLHSMWRKPLDERAVRSAGWCQLDYYAPKGSSVAAMLFQRADRSG